MDRAAAVGSRIDLQRVRAMEEARLMPTNRHFPALRAKVTDFGVPEHHGDGLALPMLVQSGNLSLEIWSSGDGQ